MTEKFVLLKGLSDQVNEAALRYLFQDRGIEGVEDAEIKLYGTEALIKVKNDEAVEALQLLDGSLLRDSTLKIELVESEQKYISSIPEFIRSSDPFDYSEPENKTSKGEVKETNKESDFSVSDAFDNQTNYKEKEEKERLEKEEKARQEREEKARQEKEEKARQHEEDALRKKQEEEKRNEEAKKHHHHDKHVEFVEKPAEIILNDSKPEAGKKFTRGASNAGISYKDILTALQQTNVPAREPLSQGDAFKEAIGNRAYLLGTVTVWSVLWVLGNIFL